MKFTIELLVILVLIGLQVSLWPQLAPGAIPALVVVAAIARGLAGDVAGGLRTAFVGGLMLDLYAHHYFGLFTGATLIAFATCLVFGGSNPNELRIPGQLGVMLLAAVVYELLILLILTVAVDHFPFFASLRYTATLNVLATMFSFILLAPLIRRLYRHTHGSF